MSKFIILAAALSAFAPSFALAQEALAPVDVTQETGETVPIGTLTGGEIAALAASGAILVGVISSGGSSSSSTTN